MENIRRRFRRGIIVGLQELWHRQRAVQLLAPGRLQDGHRHAQPEAQLQLSQARHDVRQVRFREGRVDAHHGVHWKMINDRWI
eukprot:Skav229413  [mRNA]  locus=scaffold2297:95272:97080:- [translate_table: standard]